MISLKIVLFVCVLGCTVSAMGGVLNAKTSAREAIRSEVSLYTPTDDLCTGVRCCTVGSGESCSLASMPKDQSTIVIPGGETRCIFSYSTPFAFQVKKFSSVKRHIFLFVEG